MFQNRSNDAAQAALLMLKTLADYNLTRGHPGRPKINIGIGIHTGKLMLGTVGGPNRMDGTVISDAVNLASRIEGMTKKYEANLLISEATYSRLNDKAKYAIRPLDRVKAKGKTEAVMIYAVSEDKDFKDFKINRNN
ncbi:MAG: adenylate/guanylate cyclase domain-containing protein [Candidatus Parabeggiatoa sp.]|nr:adenylate/guanylate cyclase domain-containing protein [Candidatus Parabeggiatoa sp.]